jgi:hypothetical protein
VASARWTLEELERAVGLRPPASRWTPVRVPAAHIPLGDPRLSAADAHQRSAARRAARLTVLIFCVHNRLGHRKFSGTLYALSLLHHAAWGAGDAFC